MYVLLSTVTHDMEILVLMRFGKWCAWSAIAEQQKGKTVIIWHPRNQRVQQDGMYTWGAKVTAGPLYDCNLLKT
jgi:hypothetical protein